MTAADTELRDRLRRLFSIELDDNLRVLTGGLLELEQLGGSAPAALLQTLFRAAHSLKGAAHAAGIDAAAAECHQIEDLLGAVRDGTTAADDDTLELLFARLDALAAIAPTLRDQPSAEPPGAGTSVVRVPDPVGAPEAAPLARVDMRKLTEVGRLADHLQLTMQRMVTLADRAPSPADRTLRADLRELYSAGTDLARRVAEMRVQPLADVWTGLQRTVRDLARSSGKEVRFTTSGGEIELDRAVAGALRESLLHLVRNAVDHGIEPPDQRVAAGKPRQGRVHVAASQRSGAVEVTVDDDGRGVDVPAIVEAARRQGIRGDGLELAFVPGVSESASVTTTSGRGVGLDAVRHGVERAGGTVDLEPLPDGGTRATIVVPLTRSALHVLEVAVGSTRLAVPMPMVARVEHVDATTIRRVGGRNDLVRGDTTIPMVALAAVVAASDLPTIGAHDRLAALIVDVTGVGEVALVVDAVVDAQHRPLQPLPARLAGVEWALGAVIGAAGEPLIVVNAAACVRAALHEPAAAVGAPDTAAVRHRVLLADDTMTTRTLERGILEAAGYSVLVAVDGAHAWQLLNEHGADIVVTDVDMPNMTGIELCRAIRESRRFASLPVVIVTAFGDDEHRRQAIDVHADAYIVKSEFEQGGLLDAIGRLL